MLYDGSPSAHFPGSPVGVEHRVSFAEGTRQATKGAYYCGSPASAAAALAADATGATLPACAFGPASPPMAIYSQPYSALYGLTREVEAFYPQIYPAPPAGGPMPAWNRVGGQEGPSSVAARLLPSGAFLTGTYDPPGPSSAVSSGKTTTTSTSHGKRGAAPEPLLLSHAASIEQQSLRRELGAFSLDLELPKSRSQQSDSTRTCLSPPQETQGDTRLLGPRPAPPLSPSSAADPGRDSCCMQQPWEPQDAEEALASGWTSADEKLSCLRSQRQLSPSLISSSAATAEGVKTPDVLVAAERIKKQQQEQQQQQQQQHRVTPVPSFTRTEELLAHSQIFGGSRPAALTPKTEAEEEDNLLGVDDPKDLQGWRSLARELAQANKVLNGRLKEQAKELSELQQSRDKEAARAAAERRAQQQIEAEFQTVREELQRHKHAAKLQRQSSEAQLNLQMSFRGFGGDRGLDLHELMEETMRNYVAAQGENAALREELTLLREDALEKAQAQLSKELQKLRQDVYTKDAIVGRWEQFALTLDGMLNAEGLPHAAFVDRVRQELSKVLHGRINEYMPSISECSRQQQSEAGQMGSSSRSASIGSRNKVSNCSSKHVAEREATDTDAVSAACAFSKTGSNKPGEITTTPPISGSSKAPPVRANDSQQEAVKSVRQRVQEYNANKASEATKPGDNKK